MTRRRQLQLWLMKIGWRNRVSCCWWFDDALHYPTLMVRQTLYQNPWTIEWHMSLFPSTGTELDSLFFPLYWRDRILSMHFQILYYWQSLPNTHPSLFFHPFRKQETSMFQSSNNMNTISTIYSLPQQKLHLVDKNTFGVKWQQHEEMQQKHFGHRMTTAWRDATNIAGDHMTYYPKRARLWYLLFPVPPPFPWARGIYFSWSWDQWFHRNVSS